MRQAMAIIILVGLAVLLYLSPSIYKRTEEDPLASLSDAYIEEDEVLPLARAVDGGTLNFSVDQIQQNPAQLVDFNAKVMKVMHKYGEEGEVIPLTDDEIVLLVNMQRAYYHPDLIGVNSDPFYHAIKVVGEVRDAQDRNAWIVDYKVGAPVYDVDDPNQAVVLLTVIPNTLGDDVDYYQQYLLERVDNLWYIKGWVGLDSESVKVYE